MILPDVSILMPAFNSSEFIVECIESIQNQTLENWELILVNDFSTDNTRDLILSLAKEDKRIKFLENIEKGIIPALSLAFENSRGEYITRMDSDDIMTPEKLKIFLNQIKGKKKRIVTGKVKYFSDKKVTEGYKRYENWLNTLVDENNHYDFIYRECIIASPNWMLHRSCFEQDIILKNLQYPEDYDMVMKLYAKGYKIDSIDVLTHLWREHPNRTSRNSEHYQQKAFFNLKTKRFLENENIEEIQLIGSGIKSKLVRDILEIERIRFTQFSFDGKFEDILKLKSNITTIQTSWPIDRQKQIEIEKFLNAKGLYFAENCFLF